MKILLPVSTLVLLALLAMPAAAADGVKIEEGSTLMAVLAAQTGQRVSIRTHSGNELTGTVTRVTPALTHLSELAGKEFYDAIVHNESIESVVIRTR